MTWSGGRVVRDYTLLLDPAPLAEKTKHSVNEKLAQSASVDTPIVNKSGIEITQNFNKTEMESGIKDSLSINQNASPEAFQDANALSTLQQKYTQQENSIPPIDIAEANNAIGDTDTPSPLVVEKTATEESITSTPLTSASALAISSEPTVSPENSEIQPPKNPVQSASNETRSMPIIESKSRFSSNQILLGSGLILLIVASTLTFLLLRRSRSTIRQVGVNSFQAAENIVIFDEEIKLKLDLANQYIDYGDTEGAEAILEEIILRGNSEEIKLARALLKRINRT